MEVILAAKRAASNETYGVRRGRAMSWAWMTRSISGSITGWTLGEGAELRGPDIDLLLVAAGRSAGLAALDGPGKAIVAGRR